MAAAVGSYVLDGTEGSDFDLTASGIWIRNIDAPYKTVQNKTNNSMYVTQTASKNRVSRRLTSYRIVSYRIVSYRIVSYRIESYRIVSYRIVSYRIVSYRIVSYRIVSYRITTAEHS